MKFTDIFNTKNIPLLVVSLLVIALVVFTIRLKLENNSLRDTNVTLQNELAKTDSLRRVLIGEVQIISVRYAKIEEDLNAQIKSNKELSKYIKEKDGRILFLTKTIGELKIENLELLGKITFKDGYMFAKFDTTHKYYSFSGTTRTDSSSAKLYIHSITIPDSTTIGVIEQKDLVLSGFILHSNPYILEKNAEFSINLKPTTSQESSNWIIPGAIGVGIATVAFLVGNAFK